MCRDITVEINTLVENHGDEQLYIVAEKNETAAIIFDAFSDTYKEINGFRPYCGHISVKDAVSGLKEMLDEIEDERKKDMIPITGVFFEDQPVRPIDW